MNLSIIIVSFNTKNLLLDCITSIEKTVKKNTYEVIVVDNVSTDGTREEIEKLSKRKKYLKVILNKENEGFSKANNRGVRLSSGKYILFLNPDMIMYDDTIDGMVEFVEKNEKAGAATCFLSLPNGKLDDAAHRGFPTPWRAFSHFSGLSRIFPKSKLFSGYSLSHMDITKTHEIEALAGAFMLLPRVAGDEVNWWDEDYFWYGEDLDFCYRLKKKGWKIYFVPKYKALHFKGASGGIKKTTKNLTTASEDTKRKAQQARFDAMRIFYRKHYNDKYPKFISGLVLKGIDIKHFVSKVKS